jgi:hypothetical protein
MNAIELLMLLVFFVPIGAMMLLNLAMYREARYVAQPPAPAAAIRAPAAAKPAVAEEYDFDFRQAA